MEVQMLVLSVLDGDSRDGGEEMDMTPWGNLPHDVILSTISFLPLRSAFRCVAVSRELSKFVNSGQMLREHLLIERPRGSATVCAMGPPRSSRTGLPELDLDLSFLPERYCRVFGLSQPPVLGWELVRWQSRSARWINAATTNDGYVVVVVPEAEEGEVMPLHICVFSPITKTYRELPVLKLSPTDRQEQGLSLSWVAQVVASARGEFKVFVLHHFRTCSVRATVYCSELGGWTAGRNRRAVGVHFNLTKPLVHLPDHILCTSHAIYCVNRRLLSSVYDLDVANRARPKSWKVECNDLDEARRVFKEGRIRSRPLPLLCEHGGITYVVLAFGGNLEIRKLNRRVGGDWETVCSKPMVELPALLAEYFETCIHGMSVAGDMICMYLRERWYLPDAWRLKMPMQGRGFLYEWLCYDVVKGLWVSRNLVPSEGALPFLFEYRPHWL